MLPDPSALRGAASALTMTSTEVRRLCAEVTSNALSVRWSAPAVDVVRRGLASAAAEALTAAWSLSAGASHLQTVALAIEELRDSGRRLRAAAVATLEADAAAATTPIEAEAARRALALLPDADDPYWAQVAGARPVALPSPGTVPVEPVASSPTGLVEADLAGVQGLSEVCRATSGSAVAAGASTRARVGALGLSGLDAYGLAGSRSEQWLSTTAAPLVAGAQGWALAARECDLLVRLLSAADRPGDLLADPRLAEALSVLQAQLRGPAAVGAALAGLSAADREWVADLTGIALPAPSPGGGGLLRPPSWIEVPDWLHTLWQGISEVGDRLEATVRGVVDDARRLLRAARALEGAARDSARGEARVLLRKARVLMRLRDHYRDVARASRLPGWLRDLDRTPIIDAPWVRGVSRAGVIGALLGVVWDVTHGVPVSKALTKGVFLAAVGALTVGGVGLAIAALPFELTAFAAVAVEVVAGAAVVLFTGRLFDHVAPPLWNGIKSGAGAAARVGAAGVRAAERAERGLSREAHRLAGALRHVGRLMGSGAAAAGAAQPSALGRLVPPAVAPLLAGAAAAASAALAAAAGRRGQAAGARTAGAQTAGAQTAGAQTAAPETGLPAPRPRPVRPPVGGAAVAVA